MWNFFARILSKSFPDVLSAGIQGKPLIIDNCRSIKLRGIEGFPPLLDHFGSPGGYDNDGGCGSRNRGWRSCRGGHLSCYDSGGGYWRRCRAPGAGDVEE